MMQSMKFTLILLLCLQVAAKAQEYSSEYGKIGKPEIDLVSYARDKSAEAVVLFDIGKSYFVEKDNKFNVVFERVTRIKILNESGVKFAEVEIPFYHEGGIYEHVYEIEGSTYNPDGDYLLRTSLDPTTCHDEQLNEYWSLKKFALPDVKAGSIIEYRYKISSQYLFNLRSWEFQSKIPTVFSEYVVSIIPFYEYIYVLQGAPRFSSKTSREAGGTGRQFGPVHYKDIVNTFIMKDVPAFKDEDYITSVNDYIMKLEFQLSKVHTVDGRTISVITTWPELVKTILKHDDVVKYAKKCEKLLSKIIDPDSLVNKSPQEKYEYILSYVRSNFSWNQVNGKYSDKSPNELLKDKIGNDADLNLMVVGLLNAAGIEAYPLFLSTRSNGKVKMNYPLLQSFNYVIADAVIDGENILGDATDVHEGNDMIPSKCLNGKGLLIKDGPVQWISLQSGKPTVTETRFKIEPSGEDSHANTLITATGYDALRYRNTMGGDKKKVAGRENADEFTIDEPSIIIENPDNNEKPYTMGYNTTYQTEIINKKIYLAPFLDEPLTENPLKQESRSHSIDMLYPVHRSYVSTITIPEGYKVEFIPEDDKILNDAFELNYHVENDGKTLNVIFNYGFKKALYEAREYGNLKYYFNEIIKKGNEKLVLVPEAI